MIDFNNLSPSDLKGIGIQFETQAETDAFISLIKEEMEVRVGEAVAEGRTENEMTMFKNCVTDEETEVWLRTYCPDYRSKIETTSKQLKRELILNREKIPGNIYKTAISGKKECNVETDMLDQNRPQSISEIDKHIRNIQKEKKQIGELFNKGLLSEKGRKERIQTCFQKGFIEFLDDNDLKIQIKTEHWQSFQTSSKEIKDGIYSYNLQNYSWLVYNRDNRKKHQKYGDDASDEDKSSVIRLMEEFHVPISFFQPVPHGTPIPDDSPSNFDPNYYYIGWNIWNDDGGLCSDKFEFGDIIELTDHYGLKAKIKVTRKVSDNSESLSPNMKKYCGTGTIEGYTSQRPRDIAIYVRTQTFDHTSKIECLSCKRDNDDFGFALWEGYKKHEETIRNIYTQIIKSNIHDTTKDLGDITNVNSKDYYSSM